MRKILLALVTSTLIGAFSSGCSKNYCKELSTKVCKQVPNTKACKKAEILTDQAACKGYLANVNEYIKLMNLKITKPPLKPPVVKQEVKNTQTNTNKATNANNQAKKVEKAATSAKQQDDNTAKKNNQGQEKQDKNVQNQNKPAPSQDNKAKQNNVEKASSPSKK